MEKRLIDANSVLNRSEIIQQKIDALKENEDGNK